jgi:hypothetical protein
VIPRPSPRTQWTCPPRPTYDRVSAPLSPDAPLFLTVHNGGLTPTEIAVSLVNMRSGRLDPLHRGERKRLRWTSNIRESCYWNSLSSP